MRVSTIDYHTAGEPFRIVTAGIAPIAGTSVRDRRETARHTPEIDAVRRLLVQEPRGHADMYGCFLVPPDDDGADFGVLFWHKDGYSTACGHGTIALGRWALDSGLLTADPGQTRDVTIDVPSGRVVARVGPDATVSFRNVASYVVAREVRVPTARGPVAVDLAWGGALYASVPAASVGLSVTPEHYAELVAVGREIKWALDATGLARHEDARLSGVYGTILYDDLDGDPAAGPHQRNVTIFADGAADRSPCGSGTAARVALLADEGRLRAGQTMRHDSIIGTTFTARIAEFLDRGVIPEVDGRAYRTGEHTFVLDPDDPVGTGFTLR